MFLTNADLDHVLGLFLVREHKEKLRVHCTPSVRETLNEALRLEALLESFCGIEWCGLEGSAEISFRAIPLPAEPPRYARTAAANGQSVALEFVDQQTGGRLLVAPDVATITPELQAALKTADAIFFDGTFWSENEMRAIDSTARTASEMGHLPVEDGSLKVLRDLSARHRIYTHINNTNPILMPGSPERAEVESAGIAIGEDGMEFEL